MSPNIRVTVTTKGDEWWLRYDETSLRHFNFPAGPFGTQQEAVNVALRCAGMYGASVSIENA